MMRSPSALRSALRDLVHFDRANLSFGTAARDALVAAAPLAVGAATGQLVAGLMVSLGVIQVAPFDRRAPPRGTFAWMFLASIAGATSGFVGSTTGDIAWLSVVLAGVWGFGGGLLAALGPAAGQAGLAGIILLVVLAYHPHAAPLALAIAGLLLLGGVLQTAVALAAWRRRRGPRRAARPQPDRPIAAPPAPSRAALRAALNPRTPGFRHALRLAACVAAADALARGIHLERGYWVPMTAALVLKPELGATFTRTLARLVGTGIGLVLGALLLAAVAGGVWEHIAFYAVLVFLILALGPGNYTLLVVLVTGMLVVLLALSGTAPSATIRERAIGTVLGGALALVCFVALPTGEHNAEEPVPANHSNDG